MRARIPIGHVPGLAFIRLEQELSRILGSRRVDLVTPKFLADFDADENLRLALAHPIQMIGEAASRVAPTSRDDHPEIPWSEVIGMRHKIVHNYLGLDYDIVWEVVTRDLPPLVGGLERIE